MYTKSNIMYTKMLKGGQVKMSTVRINDEIKKEVTPILDSLGISLSEAINMFLHQIKLNNGIPFSLKIKGAVELNDGNGSYICEDGYLHDYSKIDLKKLEEEAKQNKSYNSAEEMFNDLEGEQIMYKIEVTNRFKQSLKILKKRRSKNRNN